MSLMVPDGKKMKKARGTLSMREIARRSKGAFTYWTYRLVENGQLVFIRDVTKIAIADALDRDWSEISKPLKRKRVQTA